MFLGGVYNHSVLGHNVMAMIEGLSEKVINLVGKRVEAYSDQRVLLDVDGEQPGELPVVIDMIPGALLLIASK